MKVVNEKQIENVVVNENIETQAVQPPKKRGRKPKAETGESPCNGSAAENGCKKTSVFQALLDRNAVEGFNPYDGVVGYIQEDGTVKLQMPAAIAMQWFLAKYPGGGARVTINEKFSKDTYAVFDCQLVDADGKNIGFPGTGSCQYNELDEVHKNFVQSAMTKAIACALRNNGFCAPYDSTVTETTIMVGANGTVMDDDPTAKEEPVKPAPVSSSPIDSTPIMVEDDDETKEQTSPETNSEMTIEDALNFPVPFGPHKGRTMKEVVEKNGCGAIRYYTGEKYQGKAVYRAAKAVLKMYE